jgi:hypothetical protein
MTSILDIADAVTTALNLPLLHDALEALELPSDWEAQRLNDPTQTAESLGSALKVLVTGASIERPRTARGDSVGEDHEVGIAILQRVDTRDNAATDPLIRLAEYLTRHFDEYDVRNGDFTVIAAAYPVLYVPEWFKEKNCFFGFIRLTFRTLDED